jgi:hypothetical protein
MQEVGQIGSRSNESYLFHTGQFRTNKTDGARRRS